MRSKLFTLLRLFALTGLALAASGQALQANREQKIHVNPDTLAQEQPAIYSARLKGSKIILSGGNFAPGIVVYLNGKAQKIVVDENSPTTVLTVKKIFKTIEPGALADLQAQNPSSVMSEKFTIFVGKTITLDDGGKTITLAVDERVQVLLKREGYEWTVSSSDPTVLKRVDEAAAVSGSQGIFQALKAGTAKLTAVGEPLCAKATPPCGLRSILFEVTIIVQ